MAGVIPFLMARWMYVLIILINYLKNIKGRHGILEFFVIRQGMVGPSPTLLSLYIRFSFKLQFGGIGSSCKIVVSILCNFLYFREIVKLQFNFWRIKHMERWYSRELDESCEEPVEGYIIQSIWMA